MRFFLLLAILLTAIGPDVAPGQTLDPALARADSLWQAGQRDSCLELLAQTAEGARADQDASLESRALIRLGARHIALGHPAEAAPHLQQAAELAAAQADTQALLPAVRWFSLSSGLRGRAAEADSLYQYLYDTALAAGDSLHLGWATVGQASRHLDLGQADKAARAYGQAVGFFLTAGETGGELWARNGLGIALNRLGRFDKALATYAEVASRSQALGNLMTQANATNNLGFLEMLTGDPGAAERAFRLAAALFDSLGMPGQRQTPALNLALCQLELGRPAAAETILDSNLAAARRHQLTDNLGPLLIEKGRLLLARGREHAAAAQFQAALALGDTLARRDRARAVALLTGTVSRAGRPAEAEEILERYATDIPDQGLGPGGWELAHARARTLMDLDRSDQALALLRKIDPQFEDAGTDRYFIAQKRLLSRALQMRGQADEAIRQLRLAAEAWQTQREKPGEFRWREARAAAGREVFLELARLLYQFPAAEDSSSAGKDEIFRLLQGFKSRTLLERTAGHTFADSLQLRLGNRTGLKDFQSALKEHDLVLDWYTGPDTSILLAVTPTQARVVFLPDENVLLRRVDLYLEMLSLSQPADSLSVKSLAVASRSLATSLLGPVEDLLRRARNVTTCPDGPLHRLPLEALVQLTELYGQGGGPTWQLTPSLAFMLLERIPPKEGSSNIFVVAGTRGPDGKNLMGPAMELTSLQDRFENVEGRLDQADQPRLTWAEISAAQVLHLASHVIADHQTPWQSALAVQVTGPDGRQDELSAERLLGLKLNNQLTVLNGCSTAGGKTLAGEGVQSLATAFLAAGSRCVVATLWPVEDSTASRFSASFYVNLAEGLTVRQAVRAARNQLRSQPQTAASRQWGAYVVFGDGEVRIPLETRTGSIFPGRGFLDPKIYLPVLGIVGILIGRRIRRPRLGRY